MAIRTEPYKFTTMQALFNDMYIPVMRQGKRCVNGELCVMRSLDGKLACAVGQLLPDTDVKYGASGGISNYVVPIEVMGIVPGGRAWELMHMMQRAHDEADDKNFQGTFDRKASEVAQLFNLTVPDWKPKNKRRVKPGKSKKYAAQVYRRAAALLEANPDKHVSGYGLPWATDDSHCFCAVAAIDMVLDADGFKPDPATAHKDRTRIEYGALPVGEYDLTEPVIGIMPHRNDAVFAETADGLWSFNDAQPKDRTRSKVGGHFRLTPEGSKNVIRIMRRVAARLEHAGQLRSPKRTEGASK